MIHSDYLTRYFCDWCFNYDEWNYECNAGDRGDDLNFFNCIPPMLLESKYSNITNMSITHSQLKKIEYIPNNLVSLDLSCNQIEKIENIPETVELLLLNYNKIKKIENLPSGLNNLFICENIITKLENLPKKLNSLKIDNDKIIEYGDLSNLENSITLKQNKPNNLLKIPLVNLDLELNYYPEKFSEIQYINNINLQSHFFKKWRQNILTQKEKKQYSHFLKPEIDDISKLSNLLFYIVIKEQNYCKNESEIRFYKKKNCYDSKEQLIKEKLTNFRELYKINKEESIEYLMNEICAFVGEIEKPIYYRKIKVLTNSIKFSDLNKKRKFKISKYFSKEEIKSYFRFGTKEGDLIDYFFENDTISEKNKLFFIKNVDDYLLKYPFYEVNYKEDMDIEEIIDSEKEDDIFFDWN